MARAETLVSNLPPKTQLDSATKTLLYFNEYGTPGFEFKGEEVDSAAAFLKEKGFGEQASIVTSLVLLQQSKKDNVPVRQLLESLKGLDSLQLSSLVGEILNVNRLPTSALGFRVDIQKTQFEKRNIVV